MSERHDFLSKIAHLGGSRQPENQFSNTFAACFNQSAALRKSVICLLRAKHQLPSIEVGTTAYACITQEKNEEGGIYDLVLKPLDQSTAPSFTLENKLGAPLHEEQLSRYRASKAGHLTAITQFLPNVSLRWLEQCRIRWLRWHDIYDAIGSARTRNPVDEFVCRSFRRYLESHRMAFESITCKELDAIAGMFRTIANPCPDGAVNCLSFYGAGAVLELLQAVQWELENRHGSKHPIRIWGPGYWNMQEHGDSWHHLGIEIWRRKSPRLRLVAAIQFAESKHETPIWTVFRYDRETWDVVENCEIDTPVKHLMGKSGCLTSAHLIDSISTCVKKWGPGVP